MEMQLRHAMEKQDFLHVFGGPATSVFKTVKWRLIRNSLHLCETWERCRILGLPSLQQIFGSCSFFPFSVSLLRVLLFFFLPPFFAVCSPILYDMLVMSLSFSQTVAF